MGVVASLCPVAIWLDRGSIRQQGAARDVVGDYLVCGATNQDRVVKLDELPRRYVDHDDRVRLERIEWLCDVPLRHGEPVIARIYFKTRRSVEDIAVGIGFSNLEGRRLLTYGTDFQERIRPSLPRSGTYSVDIEVGSLPLAPDIYNLDIVCRSGDWHALDYVPAAVQLEVVHGPTTASHIVRNWVGVLGTCKCVWNNYL